MVLHLNRLPFDMKNHLVSDDTCFWRGHTCDLFKKMVIFETTLVGTVVNDVKQVVE